MNSIKHAAGRRQFLKTFALASVCQGICGGGLSRWLVSEASAGEMAVYRLTLDDFPELKKTYGSVLLKVPGLPVAFDRIIVTRMPNNQFYAVSSVCTHREATLKPFDLSRGLWCGSHGSKFSHDGKVLKGPAYKPLKQYSTSFSGVNVAIEFPNMGYSVTSTLVQAGSGDRLKLRFKTLTGLTYKIRFKDSLGTSDWKKVLFAKSLNGTLGNSELAGTGDLSTVYVKFPGKVGFYSVGRE